VLVPSSKGASLDIPFMKFWVIFVHFTGNGFLWKSIVCILNSANFNIFKCYNEFDRLQLSFNTGYGYNFSFLHVYDALVLFEGWSL